MNDHATNTDTDRDSSPDDHHDTPLVERRTENRRENDNAIVLFGTIVGLALLATSLPGLVSLAQLPTSALVDHGYPLLGVAVLVVAGLYCFVKVGRALRDHEVAHLVEYHNADPAERGDDDSGGDRN